MYDLFVVTDDDTDKTILSWLDDSDIKNYDYQRAFKVKIDARWVSRYSFINEDDAALFKLSFECL